MNKRWISKKKLIWVLIIIGLCAMEFPGIFFIKEAVYPFVFGMPLFYAYILFWWFYLCIVIFYAYKNNWGRNR